MAKAKLVALSPIKSGGKLYQPGDDVSHLDDADNLKLQGVAGSASDLKSVEKERDESQSRVEELEAQVADLTAQLEQAQLDLANQTAATQQSVTDAEAAELNNPDKKQIGS